MNLVAENNPVTHTVLKVCSNDPLMRHIMHGQFQPLTSASYRDQDGRHFQVFQTSDGTKFIYAPTDSSQPGALVPLKLVPIKSSATTRLVQSPCSGNPYAGISARRGHSPSVENAAPVLKEQNWLSQSPFMIPNGNPYSWTYNAAFHRILSSCSNVLSHKLPADRIEKQEAYPNQIQGDPQFEPVPAKVLRNYKTQFSVPAHESRPLYYGQEKEPELTPAPKTEEIMRLKETDVNGNLTEKESMQFQQHQDSESTEYFVAHDNQSDHQPSRTVDFVGVPRDDGQSARAELTSPSEENNRLSHTEFDAQDRKPNLSVQSTVAKQSRALDRVDCCVQCSADFAPTHKSAQDHVETVDRVPILSAEDLALILNVQLDLPSLARLRLMTVADAHTVNPKPALTRTCYALKLNNVLTKLVLQRIADDYLLEVIGKTLNGLKHLEVTGSPDVTNLGLRLLFIKSARENSSLCHMSSWIHKNLHLMNPIVNTLEYLDFSYTKANFYSRRLVALLPGAHVYQRIFRLDESDCLGNYVLLRGRPDMQGQIEHSSHQTDFDTQLRKLVGPKAAEEFAKLAEFQGWLGCCLTLRDVDMSKKVPARFHSPSTGFVTMSRGDRKLLGQVTFQKGHVTALYSCASVDVNALAQFPALKDIQASLTNIWTKKFSYHDCLTKVDAIVEPSTLLSIISHCPKLSHLRMRLRDGTLNDNELTRAIEVAECKGSLTYVWLLPSFIKPTLLSTACPAPKAAAKKAKHIHSAPHPPKFISCLESRKDLIDGFQVDRNERLVDSACKLSINAAKALLWHCPKLATIGNLAGWTEVLNTEQKALQEALENQEGTSHVKVVWNEIILTDLDVQPYSDSE